MASVASVSGFLVHNPPSVCWALLKREGREAVLTRVNQWASVPLTVSSEPWRLPVLNTVLKAVKLVIFVWDSGKDHVNNMTLFITDFTDAWVVSTCNRRVRIPKNLLSYRLYMLKVVPVKKKGLLNNLLLFLLLLINLKLNRSRWPRGLGRGSVAARLWGLRIWIPPGAWMSVCFEWFLLSGRDLCDTPISRPEETCRVWCV
jgi:hypothetical protein